jgi:hypothetical protein
MSIAVLNECGHDTTWQTPTRLDFFFLDAFNVKSRNIIKIAHVQSIYEACQEEEEVTLLVAFTANEHRQNRTTR